MKNLFQQPPFAVTTEYLETTFRGFLKNFICVNFNGNSETRGIATLLIAERNAFANHQEALTVLMQHLLFEREEWNHFKEFTTTDIEQFTTHFLLPYYSEMELNPLDKSEFKKEYKSILNSQIEFAKKLPEYWHIYNEDWFGIKLNKENVTDLTGFDPIKNEELEACFYFSNEWDNKEYFAISKNNYIYFDWFLSW